MRLSGPETVTAAVPTPFSLSPLSPSTARLEVTRSVFEGLDSNTYNPDTEEGALRD